MGVFSKLKNIFYDEEVIEEPEAEIKKVDKEIKKSFEEPKVEMIKVEEPKEEEKPQINKVESTLNERELFRSERTFSFTELDDDEEDILPSRRNVLNVESKTKTVDNPLSTQQSEQPRVFKPSPVISPIYGILDKDYTRDEVVSKKEENKEKEIETKVRDYDTVRRKAYGTLEDDLEDTLNSMNKITPEIIEEKKVEKEYEEKSNKIEDLINKIESADSTVSVGELEDKLELDNFDEEDEDEKSDKTMTDSTLEHDLFNLIDSMYDDKEE